MARWPDTVLVVSYSTGVNASCHFAPSRNAEEYMNLKEIRVSRKLKVQEVSDYLCCLPSVYSRYENGKREPSIDILLKLSKLYGVSVDCLIGNDEVVDTSITEKEAAMISAMRQADERARQDAIALLELHKGNKKI